MSRPSSSHSIHSLPDAPPTLTQTQVLEESLSTVKKSCKEYAKVKADAVMDAFRHASLMLSTLRTSLLTPKNYYELYMAIFDQLSAHLALYLYDGHLNGSHNLVQYAGNIVPRLYLMITVGSVYMRVASKMKLLNDMLEMARGVQHPTRGLFLRYYLSVMTRDHLPNFLQDSPLGTLSTSINFILQNFIEMNKLWVRLQYIGHSSERDKREVERRELRVIVGSGIVRLSQLEGLDSEHFKSIVLPNILGEIVNCKDSIAQEYLMDIIIQVFPEDFHFRTLDLFLAASAQLVKSKNILQSIVGLMDRFIAYSVRFQDEGAGDAQLSTKKISDTGIPSDCPVFALFWEQITNLVATRTDLSVRDIAPLLDSLMKLSLKCYPTRLDQVDKVLGYAKERVLLGKKSDLRDPKTATAILDLLITPIQAYRDDPLILLKLPSSRTYGNSPPALAFTSPHNILIEPHPIRPSPSAAYCGNFTDLLRLLPHTARRRVAHSIAKSMILASINHNPTMSNLKPFLIDSCDAVEAVFGELCSVLVVDCADGNVCGPVNVSKPPVERVQSTGLEEKDDEAAAAARLEKLDWEDITQEQNWVAKLIQLVRSRDGDPDYDIELLAVLRQHLGTGGDVRIRFTLPPFTLSCLSVVQKYLRTFDIAISDRLLSTYQFINETVSALSRAKYAYADSDDLYIDAPAKFGQGLQTPGDISLRLFLAAAQCSNESGHEEATYEFIVNALTVYEETITDSRSQVTTLKLIIGSLSALSILGKDNYETLVEKKVDQSRTLIAVSLLFWKQSIDDLRDRVGFAKGVSQGGVGKKDTFRPELFDKDSERVPYRNGKRVLECLQKALKIADGLLDPAIKFELFIIILERYVYLFQARVDTISIHHINSLLDLIQTNIANYNAGANISVAALVSPSASIFSSVAAIGAASGNHEIPAKVFRHYQNLLDHLRFLKHEEERSLQPSYGIVGFGVTTAGVWSDLKV
ncbi:vacuolar protein sorting-associated protein 35 [Obelidium mucronatum]|nr:vacuolar protein sorting-associated protein 35 [Obelidium mucronatum]